MSGNSVAAKWSALTLVGEIDFPREITLFEGLASCDGSGEGDRVRFLEPGDELRAERKTPEWSP